MDGDRQYSEMILRKSLDIVIDILQDHTLMQQERLNNLNPKLVILGKSYFYCAVH